MIFFFHDSMPKIIFSLEDKVLSGIPKASDEREKKKGKVPRTCFCHLREREKRERERKRKGEREREREREPRKRSTVRCEAITHDGSSEWWSVEGQKRLDHTPHPKGKTRKSEST